MSDLSSPADLRDFYDEAARGYSEMMDGEIDLPVYAEELGGLVQRIESIEGAIVDTSCGSGHMLEKLRSELPVERALIGVDLSPAMITLTQNRLGKSVTAYACDMRRLERVAGESCAAVISYFALHHLGADDLVSCFEEWRRVLVPGGQLLLATWEGEGAIDYGGDSAMVTRRYLEAEILAALESAGFEASAHRTREVDGMEMDAVFISATGTRRDGSDAS